MLRYFSVLFLKNWNLLHLLKMMKPSRKKKNWDATKEQLFLYNMTESQDLWLLSIENSEMSINVKIINFSKYLSDNSLHVFGKTYTTQNSKGDDAKKKISLVQWKLKKMHKIILFKREIRFKE